tara:strand:+ start:616 stop:1443 length:828 start_codon:yes stop_codon:yes gene_type:complete
MDAREYFESLTAQNYPEYEAEKYTQEHYPGFSLAPTAPAPIAIPASGLTGTPDPAAGISMQDAPASQDVNPIPVSGLVGMPMNMGTQQVIVVKNNSGGAWRVINGILGIIFSLIMLYVSNFIREMWDEIGILLEDEFYLLSSLEAAVLNDFITDLESMISNFSLIYTLVMILSVVMLVVSVIQFMNKPWGGKAFLGVSGLLLVVLLSAAVYEYTAINSLIDEVNEMDDEEEDIQPIAFTSTPGAIGAFCTSSCFLVFALLAFLGRNKGPSVELQM